MRRILLCIVVLSTVILSACKKDGKDCCAPPASPFNGNWQLEERLVSPGPVGSWEKYQGTPKFIGFRVGGELIASADISGGNFNRYQVVDDKTIIFSNSITGASASYRYEMANDVLTIYFNCIEPCGARFNKVFLTDPI